MPTDTITTAELVLLAECCGKVVDRGFEGNVIVRRYTESGDWYWVSWNPVEFARQRDELVEALRKYGWKVELTVWLDGMARVELLNDEQRYLTCSPMSDTPGLAVCRAALKAISLDPKPETG